MAFKVPPGTAWQDIEAVEKNDTVLTSLSRIDALFLGGHQFEAAVAQAAMVEGLLLHYLLVAKQVRGYVLRSKTEKRLAAERITFGQIKDELVAVRGFHDPSLAADVTRYVSERNTLAHHLVAGRGTVNLAAFHARGQALARTLWQHIVDQTAAHRAKNS